MFGNKTLNKLQTRLQNFLSFGFPQTLTMINSIDILKNMDVLELID